MTNQTQTATRKQLARERNQRRTAVLFLAQHGDSAAIPAAWKRANRDALAAHDATIAELEQRIDEAQ